MWCLQSKKTARSFRYRYDGSGEPDESGATGWHRNSGNAIGKGWQEFRELFGGVSDEGGVVGHVIYGVTQDGDVIGTATKVKARQMIPAIPVGTPTRER